MERLKCFGVVVVFAFILGLEFGSSVKVKLDGEDVSNAGRVQILYNGVWKGVCDKPSWDLQAANVVCRMLGFNGGPAVAMKKYKGSHDVWLTSFSCSGKETSIDKCHNLKWGQGSCGNNSLAGVVCKSGNVAFRLAGGPAINVGRLELRYYGMWGAFCSVQTLITLQRAHIICRMLGYNQAIGFYNKEDVSTRFEVKLDCKTTQKSNHCTTHVFQSLTGRCQLNPWLACSKSDSKFGVRLVDGQTLNQGRVEVRRGGVWGTVYNESQWEIADADVVCRMLGYRNASWAGLTKVQGEGFILRAHTGCYGNEMSLKDCSSKKDFNQYFIRYGDVGVSCESQKDLQVRFKENDTPHSGRVAVRYGNAWGTVCTEGLNINDAKVICRMLGYVGVSQIGSRPSSENGTVWLSNMGCNGSESTLADCRPVGWWQTTCDQDAVVTCIPKGSNTIAFRLVGGSSANVGRLEMRYQGTWGALCIAENGFLRESHVICRMMGYEKAVGVFNKNNARTKFRVHSDCNGSEKSVNQCRNFKVNRSKETICYKDHGSPWLACKSKSDSKFGVRLVDGQALNQGRVEVRYEGVWGTVCRLSQWNITDGDVVCRMLGYHKASWVGLAEVKGKGFIVKAHTGCHGNESSLKDCSSFQEGRICHLHHSDVAVNCTSQNGDPPSLQLRHIKGDTPNSGRVAVRYGNAWGTVCTKRK